MTGASFPVGLDATVYCDCFEKGKVRKPPPQPELVYVEPSGQVSLKWDASDADQDKFYDWLADSCEHGPLGELISRRLGNIALIGFLRELLAETPERFPILLAKVLYDGGHSGDYLTLDEVDYLATEIELLKGIHRSGTDDSLIRHFELQMSELVEASRSVRKPIAF
jgi:hypothetical protein